MLYELIIKLKIVGLKGKIWCKDGSFISPSKFKSSNKTAYGYVLEDDKAVSINKSADSYKWSGSNSPFHQRITSAESLTDGVSNSEVLKSIPGYSFSNCPAIYRCLNYSNANRSSYMPASRELSDLYSSIMYGRMKDDLITAGIYEECNYRTDNLEDTGWKWIWSSSQYPSDTHYYYSWNVNYGGVQYYEAKARYFGYVIPFFKF